jgi:hypothetical protein
MDFWLGVRHRRERTRRFDTTKEAEDFERGRAASPPATAAQGHDSEPQHSDVVALAARMAQLEAPLGVQEDADGPRDAVFSYQTKRGAPPPLNGAGCVADARSSQVRGRRPSAVLAREIGICRYGIEGQTGVLIEGSR